MFGKILYPVNQSRESRQAISMVIDVAKCHQSHVFVISVVTDATAAPEVASVIEEVTRFLDTESIPYETKVVPGTPALTICDLADELEVDLIVMGSEGMMVAEEHPEGSVSQKVVNLSPCPVLVVP
ncbi:MAG: universal stress protein [Oscillatoriales cyanobacterium SM2_2_1]|nr:universal stress protein [Oscillatoriales cyanobacterium SM2_2_1]